MRRFIVAAVVAAVVAVVAHGPAMAEDCAQDSVLRQGQTAECRGVLVPPLRYRYYLEAEPKLRDVQRELATERAEHVADAAESESVAVGLRDALAACEDAATVDEPPVPSPGLPSWSPWAVLVGAVAGGVAGAVAGSNLVAGDGDGAAGATVGGAVGAAVGGGAVVAFVLLFQ